MDLIFAWGNHKIKYYTFDDTSRCFEVVKKQISVALIWNLTV